MRALICAAIAAVFVLGAGCRRPSAKICNKACLHYRELKFWAKFDKAHAKDTPAQKKKARKQAQVAWKKLAVSKRTQSNLIYCRAQCRSLNNHDEIHCLIRAKTAKAADDCLK